MNEKVVLPKEVAEAVYDITNNSGLRPHAQLATLLTIREVTNYVTSYSHEDHEERLRKIVDAIYNGFEVEKTREEVAKDIYDYVSLEERRAVRYVLHAPGVEAEGINKNL